MSELTTLSDALAGPGQEFTISWATVSRVRVGATSTIVFFSLFGAPGLDAASGTNLKITSVGTLNPGDQVLVTRMGGGGWVILGRVRTIDDLEVT